MGKINNEKTSTKLKVSDNVVVLTGADRGNRGKILTIDRDKNRVIVEGINKKIKSFKANQEHPQGGMVSMEFSVDLSNVMYFCDKCKKGSRIGLEVKDKVKTRVCKSCGKSIDK